MELKHHQGLSDARWRKLALVEQLANIGSEVMRTLSWQQKNNQEYARLAFERSLELFDLTLNNLENGARLIEVARLKEAWVDFIFFSNTYKTSRRLWENEFMAYTYYSRNQLRKS